MDTEISDASIRQLKSASKKALWVFVLLNFSAIVLFLLGETILPIIMLLLQAVAILTWFLPMFIYQVAVKKQPSKLAFHKALASYREIFGQVTW